MSSQKGKTKMGWSHLEKTFGKMRSETRQYLKSLHPSSAFTCSWGRSTRFSSKGQWGCHESRGNPSVRMTWDNSHTLEWLPTGKVLAGQPQNRQTIISWLNNYGFKFSFWVNKKRLSDSSQIFFPVTPGSKFCQQRTGLDWKPEPVRRVRQKTPGQCTTLLGTSPAMLLAGFSTLSLTLPEPSSSCPGGS